MELVLNTYGLSLSCDKEGFVVTTSDGRQRIPTDGVRSILVAKGVQVTSDAVMLAVENEIEIIFIDKAGTPLGRVWSPRFGSISTIRKGQIIFTQSKAAVSWIKKIICHKIENQQALLYSFPIENSEIVKSVSRSVDRLENYRLKIQNLEGDYVRDIASTLRGWEGMSAKIYFDTLNLFIPEAYRFDQRSQHPALDVTNALLNYGYGILYGKIEGALIRSGIDPYIGVLHRDDYNRPVLVYDIIELYRVWVEYVVYMLLSQKVISEEFFSTRDDGSYWLEAMGRRVMIQSLNDYLDELITIGNLHRSRLTHIELKAQSIAQEFKKFDKENK